MSHSHQDRGAVCIRLEPDFPGHAQAAFRSPPNGSPVRSKCTGYGTEAVYANQAA